MCREKRKTKPFDRVKKMIYNDTRKCLYGSTVKFFSIRNEKYGKNGIEGTSFQHYAA